jgi:hypothetical protein
MKTPILPSSSKIVKALAFWVLGLMLLSVLSLSAQKGGWRNSFPVDKREMGTPVDNPYFVLNPTAQLHYQHGKAKLTRTVSNLPKTVDGVPVVVVEDRKEQGGKLLEVSRSFYAMDKTTQDVYCFGRDVNNYEVGQGVSHEGSWLSGADGELFGLVMPGELKAGDKFYEEVGPKTDRDRGEIIGTNEKVETPVATYEHCVHVRETSPGKKGLSNHKWYAPGIGLVKVNDLVLVRIQEIEIKPVDSDDK